MSLDISKLDSLLSQLQAGRVAATGGVAKPNGEDGSTVSFVDALQKAIENVNAAQEKSHDMVNEYISGSGKVSLHEMMITSQQADIAFQEMVKTKDKVIAAYQNIMNMSV